VTLTRPAELVSLRRFQRPVAGGSWSVLSVRAFGNELVARSQNIQTGCFGAIGRKRRAPNEPTSVGQRLVLASWRLLLAS